MTSRNSLLNRGLKSAWYLPLIGQVYQFPHLFLFHENCYVLSPGICCILQPDEVKFAVPLLDVDFDFNKLVPGCPWRLPQKIHLQVNL